MTGDELYTECRITGAAAGAVWAHVDLASCVLDSVVLAGARLAACSWQDVRFELGDLHGLTADRLRTARVALAGCRLSGATFTEVELVDTEARQLRAPDLAVRMSRLRRVLFADCSLTGLDLTETELIDVRFDGCDLTGARFDGARMCRVAFAGCRLSDIQGVAGLSGSTVDEAALAELGPSLARGLGIGIRPRTDRAAG